ncbi:META domain-containing protein [Chloracidobacterium aggregatum]|uniref:META domain-containing protein n=1 Tax=Chloracidobacterium sp. N TaxID=2821540 RepID=A0ABX8B3G2_9BACT|nr:META domain-containing protein [Chloracidobacterium aggregatum]QUV86230.1 META domain-containing protein [Chloracidobacterium sp. 2]QUV89325.1 META domain-containing protein [Chloracidobacterium sp. S]QUV95147.1 META domain-containing protein [Chloracidobacterium sp. N]QUV98357.1 META domain-containing protein [Chloracidobacterium sp. E]
MRVTLHFLPRFLALFCALTLLLAAAAEARPAGESWLDRPLTDWNRSRGGQLAPLPDPPDVPDVAAPDICNEQMRKPVQPFERTLVARGWKLFGPVQVFGPAQVVMATSGLDGMCRPLGFQAFVTWDGRYAGTLSPVAMQARTDGALTRVELISPSRLMAEFSRYAPGDPACCPSRTAVVNYVLQPGEAPTLRAEDVSHFQTCPERPAEPGASSAGASSGGTPIGGVSGTAGPDRLAGKRWTLVEVEGETVNVAEPFIEFDPASRRYTGSDGCNRFSGRYEIQGARLRFAPPTRTKRACLDEPVRRLESRFNRLLPQVNRFEMLGDRLVLYASKRRLMVLAARSSD